MEFLIISGMSGAGKSNAANALEDIGFYCIDNIPPALIYDFAKLLKSGKSEVSRVAIVTDIRGGSVITEIDDVLAKLDRDNIPYKILFLDANDECLMRRYKETRRAHPLGGKLSISDAITNERKIMAGVRNRADYMVDTSYIKTAALKQQITSLFLEDINNGMTVKCMSFGFKYGTPMEADLIFDARCLPNPFYIKDLTHLTGEDQKIVDYVMESEHSKEFVKRMLDFISFAVPMYRDEGKSNLVIAVGCTGGKHRSVALTEMIYKNVTALGFNAGINHRDITKDK